MGGFLLAGANVAFVAALVLMILIGIAEAVGLGGGMADGFELDAEIGVDAEGPSLLAWLNVGRLPLLMLLVVFLFSFGMIGLAGQAMVETIVGRYVPPLIAIPVAFAAALPITRVFGRLVAKVMPKDETTAVPRDSLIGRVAVIVTGKSSHGNAAQARARDLHGQTHYLMVEPDEAGVEFEEGASVLLVRRAGATYYAIRNTSASLQDA